MASQHHLYPGSVAEAKAVQESLRHEVSLRDEPAYQPRLIAGIDVGYDKRRNLSKAVIVLMAGKPLKMIASAVAVQKTPFPYVPGLLSFREAPVIMEALQLLPETPDLLMIDGHGIAHPRRIGIASHIGVLTGIPAIGVAKKRLTGTHEEPAPQKSACVPLVDEDGEQIGTVLRSRDNVKPLYISPGHKVSHETACRLAETYLAGYRLPEPTRLADKLSKVN